MAQDSRIACFEYRQLPKHSALQVLGTFSDGRPNSCLAEAWVSRLKVLVTLRPAQMAK